MTALSDTDRLLALVEHVYELSGDCIELQRRGLPVPATLAVIRNACEQEMFRWAERERQIEAVREAAHGDLGLGGAA